MMRRTWQIIVLLCVLLAVPLALAENPSEGGVTVSPAGEVYATQERVDFVFVVGAFGAMLGVVAFALVLTRRREEEE